MTPELRKIIEQEAAAQRIHPEKGEKGAYGNLMFYEVNDEREDAALKMAEKLYSLMVEKIGEAWDAGANRTWNEEFGRPGKYPSKEEYLKQFNP